MWQIAAAGGGFTGDRFAKEVLKWCKSVGQSDISVRLQGLSPITMVLPSVHMVFLKSHHSSHGTGEKSQCHYR